MRTILWVVLWAGSAQAAVPTLVLDLESKTVAAAELATLSEELRQELSRFPELQIISKRDLSQMLDVEQQRQMAGCDASACLAEIAGALGAARLVSGSIGASGSALLVQLQLIDTQKATVERRVSHPADAASLLEAVRAAAKKLMAVGGTLHLINQIDGAEVFVADKLVGKMPMKPFAVSESGEVAVRIEHVDYLPYETRIDITPGKTTRHIVQAHRWADLESEAAGRRHLSYGLLGSGAAAFGAAGLFFVQGSRAYDRYQKLDPRQHDQTELDTAAARTERYDVLFYASVGVGAALCGAGAYLGIVNPAEEALAGAGASVALVPGGVIIRGGF